MRSLAPHTCYPEALSFIASRLLTFRRIYYPWLCELVTEKHGVNQPANLFIELAERGAVGYRNNMIFIKDEELLISYFEKTADAEHA